MTAWEEVEIKLMERGAAAAVLAVFAWINHVLSDTRYRLSLPSQTPCRRSQEEQVSLYAQGRTAPGPIVTWVDGVKKKSRHQLGLAVDCVLRDREQGRAIWFDKATPEERELFLMVVEQFKKHGWIWGGDWRGKRRDPEHFERNR